jgi:hypothetical protein
LIALETLLLRDTNEAVQDNVATRVAFLIGKNVDERRSIIADFKVGYSLRSGFVHHGSLIDEAEKAEKFLAIAWHAIMVLLDSPIRFKNRSELLRYLEDRKLA